MIQSVHYTSSESIRFALRDFLAQRQITSVIVLFVEKGIAAFMSQLMIRGQGGARRSPEYRTKPSHKSFWKGMYHLIGLYVHMIWWPCHLLHIALLAYTSCKIIYSSSLCECFFNTYIWPLTPMPCSSLKSSNFSYNITSNECALAASSTYCFLWATRPEGVSCHLQSGFSWSRLHGLIKHVSSG